MGYISGSPAKLKLNFSSPEHNREISCTTNNTSVTIASSETQMKNLIEFRASEQQRHKGDQHPRIKFCEDFAISSEVVHTWRTASALDKRALNWWRHRRRCCGGDTGRQTKTDRKTDCHVFMQSPPNAIGSGRKHSAVFRVVVRLSSRRIER